MTITDPQGPGTWKPVDIVKWIATVIQLIGYALTGMGVTPWNIWAFFAGIILWFAVGAMWKDKAIMVVHVGAFLSLLIGYLNAS
ncbi:DUF6552 family protein [uncultured Roseobacter sp.]|uniref:DUF6552 family protein n=1 Tax=uncultured Roseobacter sp. TaxID=114847 RepID=UPI00261C2C57|nr:DUF6552 family protein [uncultured Roseobacter sp.]